MFVSKADGSVVIETDQRLSQSLIWDLQRQYFERQGVNAWVGAVPFFVTSNQLISKKYAECCLAFMQDWCLKNDGASEHPFYFVELGTGTGQLSFYILQHLKRMKNLGLLPEHITFCYVMTDFTQHNIDYWSQQSCFKPFLEQGMLDFGLFNMETDDQIELVNSKVVLQQGTVTNPIIVFGNYIFDTVANDAFKAQEGVLHELLISVSTSMENIDGSEVKSLDGLEHQFSTSPINKLDYYGDVALDAVLKFYQEQINKGHFLIPITGLRALNKLASFSHNKLLLLASDKSFTSVDELEGLNEPYIAFHGSFSLDVNFDAMGRYVENCGGSSLVPTPRDGLRTVALGYGIDFASYPVFHGRLQYHLESFPASSWYLIYRCFKENCSGPELRHLVSFLALSEWDPYIFDKFINEFIDKISTGTRVVQNELRVGLKLLAENFYYLPSTFDTPFQVGLCYFHLGDFHEALPLMQTSIEYFGQQYHSVHCMGLCYEGLGEKEKAQHYLTLSETL